MEALTQTKFEEDKDSDFDRVQKVLNDSSIDPDFRELMRNLLQVNPYFRWSAAECLASKCFDDAEIRSHSIENMAIGKIKLECDRDGAFDYNIN